MSFLGENGQCRPVTLQPATHEGKEESYPSATKDCEGWPDPAEHEDTILFTLVFVIFTLLVPQEFSNRSSISGP
jgi:hypothetical protein